MHLTLYAPRGCYERRYYNKLVQALLQDILARNRVLIMVLWCIFFWCGGVLVVVFQCWGLGSSCVGGGGGGYGGRVLVVVFW